MKTKLSGLMDGELAEHDAQVLFAELRQDEALRSRWLEYQVIGDTLKGERNLGTELTGRVMAALDAEPTVLAPKASALHRKSLHSKVLALAATIAGVAVVGWLSLRTGQMPPAETLAQQTPAPAAVLAVNDGSSASASQAVVAAEPVRQASADMQEYLIAHEAQSSVLEFRGGAENIRTVAAVGMAPAK